jgi:hypothetical protein
MNIIPGRLGLESSLVCRIYKSSGELSPLQSSSLVKLKSKGSDILTRTKIIRLHFYPNEFKLNNIENTFTSLVAEVAVVQDNCLAFGVVVGSVVHNSLDPVARMVNHRIRLGRAVVHIG